MDKDILKQVMLENQKDVERYAVVQRDFSIGDFPCYVFVGIRRAGKSFLLFQRIQQLLREGKGWDEMLYLNFEDERLDTFATTDLNLILECHYELYGKRPALFLDEVQNVAGWEKFARRLADTKHSVYITGSNANMLSREVMTTLGGRFMPIDVYPYSLKEYFDIHGISLNEKHLLVTDSRAMMIRTYDDYLRQGGMPETALLPSKRNYLSSVYQNYLGDIIARNKVSNANALRLLLKKLSESVHLPISYNRLSNLLSSVGGKISVPTVINYVEYAENAWLLLRLKNIAASYTDRESICKYYFVDNGILNLFLVNGEAALLENMVALSLFRKYGHNLNGDDRVFFYNDRIEVDFYIPEEEWAIQVCYNMADEETRNREVGTLSKITKVLACKRRFIITFDQEETLHDDFGEIDVVSAWKWCIELSQ